MKTNHIKMLGLLPSLVIAEMLIITCDTKDGK